METVGLLAGFALSRGRAGCDAFLAGIQFVFEVRFRFLDLVVDVACELGDVWLLFLATVVGLLPVSVDRMRLWRRELASLSIWPRVLCGARSSS